jgi:hypothetical protein
LEPARRETKPSATTEEQQLTVARQNRKLIDAGEEGDDGLKTVLKRVFSMVGVRAHHIPVGGDKLLLHSKILKHYGNHSAAEIELAFEMAITGQLSCTGDDVKIFDQFTFEYFARIMNAYRSWAAAYIRQEQTKEPPPEPRKPTPQEMNLLNLDYACARAWMHQRGLKPPLSLIHR